MTDYGYGPDPATAEPWPGAPRFFVRYYDLAQSEIELIDRRTMEVVERTPIFPEGGILPVFGFAAASTDPEDRYAERQAWEGRRSFAAWCYSRLEPRGEYGFVAMGPDVREITREAFEDGLRGVRAG